jgi:amino acid adenylation domain-containing protein
MAAKTDPYLCRSFDQPARASIVHPSNGFRPFEKAHIEQAISDRFEQQVYRYPDKVAVKTTLESLTYIQLNRLANQIARMILAKCGKSNEPVVLVFEQGAFLIAAILGTLKAGKIYVPLDPLQPRQRNAEAFLDSTANLILTDDLNFSYASELAANGICVVNMDELDSTVSTENVGLSIDPDRLAYIFYTSGTTGQPKGIADCHRNVLHNIMRYTNSLGISAADRLTLLQSCSFSGSVSSLFCALLNGATSFPFNLQQEGSDRLASWVDQEGITIYHSVPSIFRLIATGKYKYPALRVIRLEGDQASPKDLHLYKEFFPDTCILVNGLGATEYGIARQYFFNKTTPVPNGVVPIGYSTEDMEILLFDESGQQVGVNCVGEIVVRSRYLAPGYWRRPELTENLFWNDTEDLSKRLFRTEDMGRLQADGCIEYLGRKNFHMKIRGQWVEIPEIEKVLHEFGAFKDVIVITVEDPGLGPRLVAYLVPSVKPTPKIDTIRKYLSQRLPALMIPTAFVMLDAIPLNSFGKVDRGALQAPSQVRPELTELYIDAQNLLQLQLKQIWEEVLQVRPIGIRDNFFDLGGDSLRALNMLDQLEQSTGRNLHPQLLLTEATIERVAVHISGDPEDFEIPLVRVQSGGARRPFFFLHGDYLSGGFYCRSLAMHLGADQPFYALPPCGVNGHPVPDSYENMAKLHLQILRAEQPSGPYMLGGTCNGGLVAYEMARQLSDEGEKIAALILVSASAQNIQFRVLRKLIVPLRILSRRAELTAFWLLWLLQRFWCELTLTGMPLYMRVRNILNKYPKLIEELSSVVLKKDNQNSPARISPHLGKRPHVSSRKSILHAYKRIDREYMPAEYSGKVTLLWAKGEAESPGEAMRWWSQVAGEVDLQIIPGSQHAISLTKHAEAVAKIMKSCLASAV